MAEVEAGVIWENVVDSTWRAWVTRKTGYTGTLRVARVKTGEVVLEQTVALAYEARFGPDAGDVAEWEGRAAQAIADVSQEEHEEP